MFSSAQVQKLGRGALRRLHPQKSQYLKTNMFDNLMQNEWNQYVRCVECCLVKWHPHSTFGSISCKVYSNECLLKWALGTLRNVVSSTMHIWDNKLCNIQGTRASELWSYSVQSMQVKVHHFSYATSYVRKKWYNACWHNFYGKCVWVEIPIYIKL